METFNEDRLWPYFDGITGGDPRSCAFSGIFYLSRNHCYWFKFGLFTESNNYVKLSALRILLWIEIEKSIKFIKIFGDSQLIIRWIIGEYRMQIIQLVQLLQESRRLKRMVNIVYLQHIFWEINSIADELTKGCMLMEEGQWNIV